MNKITSVLISFRTKNKRLIQVELIISDNDRVIKAYTGQNIDKNNNTDALFTDAHTTRYANRRLVGNLFIFFPQSKSAITRLPNGLFVRAAIIAAASLRWKCVLGHV